MTKQKKLCAHCNGEISTRMREYMHAKFCSGSCRNEFHNKRRVYISGEYVKKESGLGLPVEPTGTYGGAAG